MTKIGFDSEKYLSMQSQKITERINEFGGKLYLEFGGKLFDDNHAARVLPGFEPDSKIKMLSKLKDKAEIVKFIFNEYAKAEILYIDDLFKGKVTETDVNVAFQLINERYNTNLVTIVSSELLLKDLREIDEAIAGRLKEKAKSYCIQVAKDSSKNYRFKDEIVL